MGNIIFTEKAWEDYLYWQAQDKKTLKRINQLIKDIERCGYDGTGKPEPLRGNLSGYWSRRIDEVNRLVYRLLERVHGSGEPSFGSGHLPFLPRRPGGPALPVARSGPSSSKC